MVSRISVSIKKHPVVALYFLAFTITWLGWVPQAAYSRGLFPFDSPIFYVLGGVGPLLAAFIVLGVLRGEAEFGELFSPYLRWRSSVIWYFIALFGYQAMWLLALVISGDLISELAKLGQPSAILVSFLIYFVAAIPEEVAWRGFVLPRLQLRHSALFSSIIVGVLWGLWHLPLLLNSSNSMSTHPIALFILDVIARSVVYTWIFNNTQGSLLFVTLFHASSNAVGSFLGYENLIITFLVAAVLVLVFGAAHLSRQGSRQMQNDIPDTITRTN